jgi:hypothetical protein
MPEAASFFVHGLKFSLMLPILTKAASLRQITVSRNLGNQVSENETEIRDQGPEIRSRVGGDGVDHAG